MIIFERYINKNEISTFEMIKKTCDVRFLSQTNNVIMTISFDDHV